VTRGCLALLTGAPVIGIAAVTLGSECTADSAFGACGYGAELQRSYACDGNVQVVTQENCAPKAPTVTRTDCSASGEQCLEMRALPTESGAKLFGCAHPCATNADCPVDLYCAGGIASTADGGSTCRASMGEGFECNPSTPCASGLVCANTDGGTSDAGARDAATPTPCQPTSLGLPDEALGKYSCSCQRR
jgi:Dickkopf N-terminal cysteine-rich region